MYLHAGNNKIIRQRTIIGIFDMDNATVSAATKKFLVSAEKSGRLQTVNEELPKSFILYTDEKDDNKAKICISQISTSSLLSRIRKNERNRLF